MAGRQFADADPQSQIPSLSFRNTEQKLHGWLLVAILLLAFGLRMYRLGADSLWYDETVSVHLAGKTIPDLVAHTAGDIHPPGYYVLLHGWTRLTGSSEFSSAYLSLFFGLLLAPLAYRLAVWTFGRKAGVLASLLVAVSPYNLWYSQEVRMYTLGAVLGVGVLCALIQMVSRPHGGANPSASQDSGQEPRGILGGSGGPLVLYVVCGALGLWMLYYFAFLLVAANAMVGAWWLVFRRKGFEGWRWLGRWLLAQGVVLLLYLPWLPNAWRQATEPPVPPWRGFTALADLLVETWSALGLGQSVDPLAVWPALLLFLALFGLGLFSRSLSPRLRGSLRDGGAIPWLMAGYVLIPVALIYLASFAVPLYHVRYIFTYSTPFYVLAAAGLAWLWGRWRPAAWLGLVGIVAFSGVSLYRYHTDAQYASDDHRAAVQYLAERWRPGDAILVNAGYAYTALVTYWDGAPIAWRGRLVDETGAGWREAANGRVVVFQSGTVDGAPSLGWGDPSSDFYAMTWEETEEALERLFAEYDRVWVYRIYDTVTDPDGAIRDWLVHHGVQFEERAFSGEGQLRVQGFLTERDPLADAEIAYGTALEDGSLVLEAGSSLPVTVPVGGGLDLAPVWRVVRPPEGEVLLFAGLFDESDGRWAQADERVMGSLYPASDWQAGSLERTPLRVPVPTGTPPGRYELEIGWYRFVDGQPEWLPWPSGERLALGEVEVVAPEDWRDLPPPAVAYPAGVSIGEGVVLVGFDAATLETQAGGELVLDLYWQARNDAPERGQVVLRLEEDGGRPVAESASAPAGGRAPFTGLEAGQVVRDRQTIAVPGGLAPGVYNLSVGRQSADGPWLAVKRGFVPLGSTFPLATVRVLGRDADLMRPEVQTPLDARFGESIGFVGYDLSFVPGPPPDTSSLDLTLCWQALATMDRRYKIFVHLLGEGGPSDVRSQADVWPHLPTTGWVPGEYLCDELALELGTDLPAGAYTLVMGLYDEESGLRLPLLDPAGQVAGDSLVLEQVRLGN